MANTLSFSKYRPPILPVELLDKQKTVLHVTPPTVALQEELRARMTELNALLTGGDEEKREGLWDLAARLMSCNRNMLTLTPDVLRTVYGLDEEDLVVFYDEYASFLSNLENAKN